jgi:hypothetical protein
MNPERNIEQNSAARSGSQFAPVIRTAAAGSIEVAGGHEALDTWLDQELTTLEQRFGDWTTAASIKAAFRKGGR